MSRFCIFLIGCLFSIMSISALQPHLTRNYAYRYFTSRDGLVQMQVLCAYQDKDGYMWFGTKGGVSRFDGVSFKNFTNENGLIDGDVSMIGECGAYHIIFYQKQLALIDELDRVILLKNPDNMMFANHKYGCLPLTRDDVLLLNLEKQDKPNEPRCHYVFNASKRTFKRVVGFNDLIEDFDKDKVLTNKGIYRREGLRFILLVNHRFVAGNKIADWETNTFYFHDPKTQCNYIYKLDLSNHMECVKKLEGVIQDRMVVLPDGSYLYCKNGFVPHFEPGRNTNLGVNTSFLEKFFVDREGNLWVTTNNGLYNVFNLEIEEVRLGLAEVDNIWSLLEDSEHNMWFGGYGTGLWRLEKNGQLTLENTKNHNWKDQYFGTCKSKSGILFFPQANGLSKYENHRFQYLGNSSACLSSFYDENTQQIYYSGCDSLTYRRGVYKGYGKARKFCGWNKGYPQTIKKDANGVIRVGSFHGRGRIVGDSLVVDTDKKPYDGVISMVLDNKNRLWKGTNKGIYLEFKNGKEIRIAPELKGCVTDILNYHNRYLIVGTDNNLVIVRIDGDLSKCEVIKIPYEGGYTGLESGTNGMIEDHNGDIWMTTAMCVLKFNPDKLFHSKSNALPPIRVSVLGYSQDNANWINVLLDKQGQEIEPLYRFLRFDFIANSISAPKALRFRYKLKGLTDKWSEEIYRKSVNFTNLYYGTYQFQVQCSLDGVRWSKVASSPDIVILRPFWLRWFSLLSYFILFVLVIGGVTRFLVRRNQRKKLELLTRQKLENELQLKTLQSKIIPHFTKNVLSAIGYLAMTDRVKIGHYISIFSRFTTLTLENADKNFNTLKNELNYITHYLDLEKLRFDNRFDFTIKTEPDVDEMTLIPSMALHTYCDNAIRHGLINKEGFGLLVVHITRSNEGVLISVTDNGIGRERATILGTRGNGQGLSLIDAQIEFYNKKNKRLITQKITDLFDPEGNAMGTMVELYIPLDYRFES